MFEREINPSNITEADIAVGLASYQEADTISFPTIQADEGLKKYFSDLKPVIINCDNCSPDGTEQAFLNTATKVPKIYITTPPDTPGKGYNFENMFRKASELGVKILICVDADLESITPEWIKYMGEAIRSGYDYATPIYSRHKYDGTITNNICYPLVYGLAGKKIRQPIGGDFSLSNRFFEHVTKQMWHRTTKEYGIDIFLSLNAIFGGFNICEIGLGAKIHKPSAPKLGPMFFQVVSTAFHMIIKNIHQLKNVTHIQECPLFGLRKMDPAQDLNVDRNAILNKAEEEYAKTSADLKTFLPVDIFLEIENIFKTKDMNKLDATLWTKTIYHMITAFAKADDKAKVVEALRSLYFARVVSFMNQTWEMSSDEAEIFIIEQAETFFKNRQYLLDLLAK
ncbi:glycosyltransferase [Candidatus Auribacterota bacterium]